MNAKDMLDLLRDNINEATAGFWSDVNLMRRLNVAQNRVALKVAQTPGQWLVKSASVTPSDGVITLPSDCAKPIYLEQTSDGTPLSWLANVSYRRLSRGIGSGLSTPGSAEAYPLMSTIEVNISGYSEACALWYQARVPDLVAGTAAAGGTASLTFPDDRVSVRVADYYNTVGITIISGTGTAGRDTVTDYTAARVATVSGTYDATTVFGTISKLPPETHNLMILEATVDALLKPSAEIDPTVRQTYRAVLKEERSVVEAWLESRVPEQNYTTMGEEY